MPSDQFGAASDPATRLSTTKDAAPAIDVTNVDTSVAGATTATDKPVPTSSGPSSEPPPMPYTPPTKPTPRASTEMVRSLSGALPPSCGRDAISHTPRVNSTPAAHSRNTSGSAATYTRNIEPITTPGSVPSTSRPTSGDRSDARREYLRSAPGPEMTL
jgi:hypothetical protein